ncbi:MAG TPA: glycosyltransferase family 39 protein [Planctomycetota bacterium]
MPEQTSPESAPSRIAGFWSRPAAQLGVILVVAASLRLYRLEEAPPGIYCDEVALAANARSIGRTGTDLSGVTLPLYSEERSYEFWGARHIVYQPVYLYASIPFALALDPSIFAARLPSVVFALLAIAGTWRLVRKLFDLRTAALAAGLLALSPWHLQFSRIGFEAISLPALTVWAVWCLWEGLERPRYLFGGAVLAGLATYAYPVAKVFVPLLLAVFVAANFAALRRIGRPALGAALALAVVVGPNLYLVATDTQQERVHDRMILSGYLENERAVAFLKARDAGGWAGTVIRHRPLLVPFVFAYNYASYFLPDFLFLNGDPNPRHNSTAGGACPFYYAPLLIAALATLIRDRRDPRARFLGGWLLAYPVAASLTLENPHAIRAIPALPLLEILCALGLLALKSWSQPAPGSPRRWLEPVASVGGLIVLVAFPFELVGYAEKYYGPTMESTAPEWQHGLAEAAARLKREQGPDAWVRVSPALHNGYLYFVYFADLDPRDLRRGAGVNEQLAPFRIRVEPPTSGSADPRDLWLLTDAEWKASRRLEKVWDIPYPDGTPHLVAARRSAP